MGKKRLQTKKQIINVDFNERSKSFSIELGKDITSEDVITSVVFIVETFAEASGKTKEQAWNLLEIYHKGRKTE